MAHAQGVANRDIKLENTLLSHNPSQGLLPIVKLCDFGFSKVRFATVAQLECGTWHLDTPQDVNRDSVADTKVGTLDYFAPEVLDLRQGETYDATQAVGAHSHSRFILVVPMSVNQPGNSPLPCFTTRLTSHTDPRRTCGPWE